MKQWPARYTDWQAEIIKVDSDLLDKTSLNAKKHLGPDQFWGDPIGRAQAFLNKFTHT